MSTTRRTFLAAAATVAAANAGAATVTSTHPKLVHHVLFSCGRDRTVPATILPWS